MLSIESVFREVDNRMQQAQRSLTAGGELSAVHVDNLAEKISAVLGKAVPNQVRERKSLIEGWHRHMLQQQRGM